jgi:hypothetical protein
MQGCFRQFLSLRLAGLLRAEDSGAPDTTFNLFRYRRLCIGHCYLPRLEWSGMDKVASYSRRIIDSVSLALRLKSWDGMSMRQARGHD